MESKGVSCQATGTSSMMDGISDKTITPRIKSAAFTGLSTKYVSKSTSTASKKTTTIVKKADTEADVEEEATDNLLGRLRNGIRLIQTHARKSIAQCEPPTDESRLDMALRLESSILGMLRAEKSFLNTTRFIAEVVDEFAPDYEDDPDAKDEDDEPGESGENIPTNETCLVKTQEEAEQKNACSSSGDGDTSNDQNVLPVIFRPTIANGASIRNYGKKLSKIMLKRLSNYEASLTDDVLRREKAFLDLQEEIRFGRQDAENMSNGVLLNLFSGSGDMDMDNYSPSKQIRFDYNEDDYFDESVLPTLDPITRQPIYNAVRNKFCNHVFEEQSIMEYILDNPDKTCPMLGCRNERPLMPNHFVKEEKLSEQIRTKNEKLMGYY